MCMYFNLYVPQPRVKFLNTFFSICELENGKVEGALGVETLVNRVVLVL